MQQGEQRLDALPCAVEGEKAQPRTEAAQDQKDQKERQHCGGGQDGKPGDRQHDGAEHGAFELGVQILYVAGLVTKHGAQRERVRGVKRACGYADAARTVGGGLRSLSPGMR